MKTVILSAILVLTAHAQAATLYNTVVTAENHACGGALNLKTVAAIGDHPRAVLTMFFDGVPDPVSTDYYLSQDIEQKVAQTVNSSLQSNNSCNGIYGEYLNYTLLLDRIQSDIKKSFPIPTQDPQTGVSPQVTNLLQTCAKQDPSLNPYLGASIDPVDNIDSYINQASQAAVGHPTILGGTFISNLFTYYQNALLSSNAITSCDIIYAINAELTSDMITLDRHVRSDIQILGYGSF